MKRISISMAIVAAMAMLGGTAQAAAFYKDAFYYTQITAAPLPADKSSLRRYWGRR